MIGYLSLKTALKSAQIGLFGFAFKNVVNVLAFGVFGCQVAL